MNREVSGLKKAVAFALFALAAAAVGLVIALLTLNDFVETADNPEVDAESTSVIVGFSQIGAESAWRKHNSLSIKEAAQSKGVQLLFENADQKQENQIKAIRSFIAYRVDVIAFVPIVADGWDNVLREAKEAGIPVLVTDRKIITSDESLYAGFIGTDSLEEGRNAGRFLVRKFSGQPRYQRVPGRPVRVLEITGTEGSSVAAGRARGFRDALAGRKDFAIVHSESGDFLRSKGFEIAVRLLDESLEFDALYSHNDSMTLGFLDAMRERGIRPGVDVVIVSIDAEQAAIDALRAGDINCVVECNPKTGGAIIDLSIELAAGRPIPRLTHVEERVFTEDDPDLGSVAPRGY